MLLPEGTTASAEVRGGAPATRELDLLAPERLVERLDALVLTGGSAFGLAAADGVVGWCVERGVGFPTGAGPVPIVAAMALYDLAVGDPTVRPGPAEGRAACVAATAGQSPFGRIGAGTGATVGKWRGASHARGGGLGSITMRHGDLVVSALVAVNAFGDIDLDGAATARVDDLSLAAIDEVDGVGNTTVGLIVTNARLSKLDCLLVAQSGHDGLARSIFPAHTRFDGDALVAAATGQVEAGVDIVRLLAVVAVERAVRSVAR